jgi:indolepyruvate ferredoxin oxidoreductase beta subunit
MAQRGGSVVAQVRFGAEVHSPLVARGSARVLGSLEQVEALRFWEYLAQNGLAVVNAQAVVPVTVSSGSAKYPEDVEARLRRAFPRLVYMNAAEEALKLGDIRAANTVLLGAISKGLDLPIDAWQEAIASSVKAKLVDLNIRAFELGRNFH